VYSVQPVHLCQRSLGGKRSQAIGCDFQKAAGESTKEIAEDDAVPAELQSSHQVRKSHGDVSCGKYMSQVGSKEQSVNKGRNFYPRRRVTDGKKFTLKIYLKFTLIE
jgi:hypothetical protein